MAASFYVTTPIYYVNDVPHIGHAYTTIAADVLARYHRMLGERVFFLTGTDEHGQKIEQAAQAAGLTPQALADRVVVRFQETWKTLHISHDDFIRTTESRHRQVVQNIFQAVFDKGDIYLGEYEDWYCTYCEAFVTETQLQNGKCPDCQRDVRKLKEESYFFRLSRFTKALQDLLTKHPDLIQPPSRRNEVLSFVQQGLKDLSVSRTSFQWGIPIPANPKHVIYVWFDALFNYISALGFQTSDMQRYDQFWPVNVHIVGKDILRFHAVYWPAFLLSAGLPLPRKIFAHGWWTIDGKKMSKSLGNVVDPNQMAEKYGADPFRYFLLREVPFGQDGNFSIALLEQRLDADLANDLGNLYSRVLGMFQKYFGGSVASVMPHLDEVGPLEVQLRKVITDVYPGVQTLGPLYESLAFQEILIRIWQVLGHANRYIDSCQPWSLAKEGEVPEKKRALASCMAHLMEVLRLTALALHPFMPAKSLEMWEALGIRESLMARPLAESLCFGRFPSQATPLAKPPHLFPRLQKK